MLGYKLAAERSYTLREAINKSFDSVRASADAILFEFDLLARQVSHGVTASGCGNHNFGRFS
jgi:hypothetical protein